MTPRELYGHAVARSGKGIVVAELAKLGIRHASQIDQPGNTEPALRALLARLAGEPEPVPAASAGAAEQLWNKGYDVVAIRPAEKRPFETGWTQRGRLSLEDARRIDREKKSVGIRTGAAPDALVPVLGLDLDVLDPALAADLTQHALDHFGPAPIRTGRAPKALLPYRTDAPLRKHRVAFVAAGATHAVELIATGQQFVAAGIHPDTQQPYSWNTELPPAEQLTLVTEEQVHEYFATVLPAWLQARGIEVAASMSSSAAATARATVNQNDLLARDWPALRSKISEVEEQAWSYPEWAERAIPAIFGAAGPHNRADAIDAIIELSSKHPDRLDADGLLKKLESYRPPYALGEGTVVAMLAELGVDMRDYVTAGAQEQFEALVALPPDESRPTSAEGIPASIAEVTTGLPPAVARLNESYVWLRDGIYCRDDHTIRAADKIRGFEATRPGEFQAWATHPARATARRLTFDPTQRPYTITPDGDFNAWPGFAVEPSSEGSDARILHHIREHIAGGDPVTFEWVMQWLAAMIQDPVRRPGTALVLRGPQGSGKTTLFVVMQKILGPRLTHMASQSDEITAKHNDHLEGRVLLGSEEAMFAGDRRGEGLLKTIITSADLTVEPKFAPRRVTPNLIHLMMTTNSAWAVPAGESERRFCVIDVKNPNHTQDRAYFKALYDEIANGGAERFMYRLKYEVEIDWDFIARPLATEALLEQQEDSMTDLSRAWYSILVSGQLPGGPNATPEDVLEAFRSRLSDPYEKKRLTATKLGRFLKQQGAVVERPRGGDSRRRVYRFPSLAEARAAFASRLAVTPEWEPAEDWLDPLELLAS